jgi:transcription elongation factor Elf1
MHEENIKMKQQIDVILCDICRTTISRAISPIPNSVKVYNKDLCIQCSGLVFYHIQNKISKHTIETAIKETQDFMDKNKNIRYY